VKYKLTIYFMIALVVVIAVYDTYAELRYGQDGTISLQLWWAMQAHPIIGVALGVLVGHLAWQNYPGKNPYLKNTEE